MGSCDVTPTGDTKMLSEDQEFDIYDLPPFANEANKKLAQQIKEKEASLAKLGTQLDDNNSRSDSMASHIRNLRIEMAQTQVFTFLIKALYDAKMRQLETEEHFKKLAARETSRLRQEMSSVEAEIQAFMDKINAQQGIVFRQSEKIDNIRSEMKMTEAELKEYLEVQNEKEQDGMVIEKYSKEDENKIKTLNLQTEGLMNQVMRASSLLDAAVTETQLAQLELNQTSEQLRRAHQERLDLVDNWAQVLEKIQKKDDDILKAQEEHLRVKEEIREKQELIKSKQEFLDKQNKENEDREKKIEELERTLARVRLEQSEENQALVQFQDELHVVKNQVYKTSAEVAAQRSELGRLNETYASKQELLESTKQKLQETTEKLEKMRSDKTSLELKAKELEAIIKKEEQHGRELDKDIKTAREKQIFQLKQEQKHVASSISSTEASIRTIQSKINKLEQDSMKQKAMLYSQDFQIEQLDRRLRRAQGERSDEEKEELQRQINALTQKLDRETKIVQVLTLQLRKLQDDLRVNRKKEDNLIKEKTACEASLHEVNLYLEGVTKQLANKIREKEDVMVEESVLKLELRKLREYLNSRADEVYSLENRKIELSITLEERTKEISIHKDLLRIQLKNAEEERSSAAAELRERRKKVENLRKRYEILMSQFGGFDGEEGAGEERSQAYFIIKAAQKKEELQKEGDKLDAEIRQAEKEVKELENTLRYMNDRNEQLRMQIHKAEMNKHDLQHREMLEQQYRITMEKYRAKRMEYQQMCNEVSVSEQKLNQALARESNLLQTATILEKKLNAIETEVKEQEVKKTRAVKLVRKIIKDISTRRKDQGETEAETDLKLRMIKDKTNIAIVELVKLAEEQPELQATMQELFAKPPSQPVSRTVSRPETMQTVSDVTSTVGSVHSRRSMGEIRNSTSSNRPSQLPSQTNLVFEGKDTMSQASQSASSSRSASLSGTPRSSSLKNLRQSAQKVSSTTVKLIEPSFDSQMFGSSDNMRKGSISGGLQKTIRDDLSKPGQDSRQRVDRLVRLGRPASAASSRSDTSSRN